jgi:hypothetical protein
MYAYGDSSNDHKEPFITELIPIREDISWTSFIRDLQLELENIFSSAVFLGPYQKYPCAVIYGHSVNYCGNACFYMDIIDKSEGTTVFRIGKHNSSIIYIHVERPKVPPTYKQHQKTVRDVIEKLITQYEQ